jgi:hypothetical protein
MDKLLQLTIVADHPQCGVTCARQIPSRINNPPQHQRQRELANDGLVRVE